MSKEKTALFIDGSNFYAAARALNMDIDYAKLHNFFSADVNLIRAYYYTALPEDQEFSSLRPLIDWLDYNGFAVVSKLTREFIDPETGKRRIKGNMDMELALDMLKLALISTTLSCSQVMEIFAVARRYTRNGCSGFHCLNDKIISPMVADSLRRMADIFIEMETIRDQIGRLQNLWRKQRFDSWVNNIELLIFRCLTATDCSRAWLYDAPIALFSSIPLVLLFSSFCKANLNLGNAAIIEI